MKRSSKPFALARALAAAGRQVQRIFLGRRFVHSLERNKDAADKLDSALKEMLELNEE